MANIGATAVLKATFDSKDFDQGMHRAQKRTKDFQNQTQKANGQLRLMRGGLGQLGHQVQDVAVQLQAGQNAMLVFGQQGSQIASLMGPNGAIIGAVLAVGAAIATSLMPSLFGATEAMKMLDEASKNLIDNFDDLEDAEKAFARTLSGKTEEEMTEIIKKLENANKDLIVTYIRTAFSMTKVMETEKERADRLEENNQRLATARKLLKAMQEKVDDTTDSFIKFKDKITEQTVAFLEGDQGLEEYKISLSNMNDEEKLAARIMLDSIFTTRRLREERERLAKEQKALQLRQMLSGLQAEQQEINNVRNARESAARKAEAEAKAQKARFESLRGERTLEIASIGKTAEQIERLKLIHEGYSESQIQELERLRQLKEAREQAYQAQVDQQAEDMGLSGAFTTMKDEFANMDAAMQQAMLAQASTVLGTVGQTMGAVSQLFKEGSSEAKAFMLVSKGLEAANAIIAGLSGEMAIKAAYAKMAMANPAMAPAYTTMGNVQGALMKTMGFVNAGMIMGQAAASFEGGGFTGHGARVAGLDNKGGFPAILHPNETVIDHTKGQSMATNVTINIQANDTKGFDELLRSRRGEIIGIVNKAINNRGVSSLI